MVSQTTSGRQERCRFRVSIRTMLGFASIAAVLVSLGFQQLRLVELEHDFTQLREEYRGLRAQTRVPVGQRSSSVSLEVTPKEFGKYVSGTSESR